MKNTYKSILSTMAYMLAIVTIIQAVFSGATIKAWVIVLFIGISLLYAFSRSLDKRTISVKYFEPGLMPIKKINVGDWIDLRAAETVVLKEGEYKLIRLGVGMILPAGYEAHVLPRSSTPSIFGIMCANSMGVIDNSYCGDGDEWRFPAYAIRDTVIEKGDRIAQFRIVENQPEFMFETVSSLRKESRGGLGSTGKR